MTVRGTTFFLTGLSAMLAAGWLAFPRVLYKTRAQPAAFNHRVHVEKGGSKCEDCHAIAADGSFAEIPRVETCAGCHAAPLTDKPAEKLLVERYITPQREIPWMVYARQPDNVHFSHATHVSVAKIACERCHGEHGKTEHLRPYQENRISGYSRDIWGHSISRISFQPAKHPAMKMDDCAACHRERGVETSCMACHR
jgi:hypothetical protein